MPDSLLKNTIPRRSHHSEIKAFEIIISEAFLYYEVIRIYVHKSY
jgi:hypothetical protein